MLMPLQKKINVAKVKVLFGVLRNDKGKPKAVLEEDLAKKEILVTNLSIWLSNPTVA